MSGGRPSPSQLSSLKTVAGADPAAGSECTITVPAGKWWEIMGFSVSLAQGATQTPWPSLTLDDGTTVFWQGFSGTAAMSVSTTTVHSWAPGLTAAGAAASTANQGAFPAGIVLPAGYRIKTVTSGIGANSNYGPPILFVCELG